MHPLPRMRLYWLSAKSHTVARLRSPARAEVAELADAPDSKSGSPRGVWVRFPPSAPERWSVGLAGGFEQGSRPGDPTRWRFCSKSTAASSISCNRSASLPAAWSTSARLSFASAIASSMSVRSTRASASRATRSASAWTPRRDRSLALHLADQRLRDHVVVGADGVRNVDPVLGLVVAVELQERLRCLAGQGGEPAALADRLQRLAPGDALPRGCSVIAGQCLDRTRVQPNPGEPEPLAELLHATPSLAGDRPRRVEVSDHRLDRRPHAVDHRRVSELVTVRCEPPNPSSVGIGPYTGPAAIHSSDCRWR